AVTKLDNLKIKISDEKINSKSKFQYFKTTNRFLYDKELNMAKDEGYDEVIFLNENNEVTEGSITNFFIETNGKTLTPKISCGILNGIYRQYLIDNSTTISEKKLKLSDIIKADKIYLVNSVRKEMRVKEIWKDNIRISTFP
ncbi:MAG: aminotransferase class IV, partial [Arcobacter sp.]|nr:aminotransferase class IV [Arcobacter sp.]